MRIVTKTFLILVFLNGCVSELNYWSIEDFKMANGILPDKEKVEIIYFLAGPKIGTELDFYSHAIAISSSSKDTFNILTFQGIDILEFSDSNYNFIYHDHPVLSKFASDFVKKNVPNLDTTKMRWSKYDKVLRDPEFDYLAKNNYKTVIGALTKD